MFDIGFWELAMVGLVALLVIGPERLPKVARTVGLWLGRARRLLASVKADIDRELKADELREILNKQARNPLEEILEESKSTLHDFRRTTEQSLDAARAIPTAPPHDKRPVE